MFLTEKLSQPTKILITLENDEFVKR